MCNSVIFTLYVFLGDMNTAQWICIPPVVVGGSEYTCRHSALICIAAGYNCNMVNRLLAI